VAYWSWIATGGPTLPGVAVLPISMLVVAALHVLLARRRLAAAGDWVALGYTAGIVVSVAVLAVHEALHGIYQELTPTGW
jgi:hypothetical protein